MRSVALLAWLVLLAALAAPAHAQEAKKLWRIGFISPYSAQYDREWRAGFTLGMRELGYAEGRSFVVEMRHAEGATDRLPALARELVERKPDLLLIHGSATIPHAIAATRTIPIVFLAHPDPVGQGVVKSLARPGGNVTGLSDLHTMLGAKRIELLKQIAPSASRVGILLDQENKTYQRQLQELQEAAPALQLRLIPFHMRTAADIATAFEAMRRERIDGLHILGGTPGIHIDRVVEASRQQRLPTVSTTRKAAEEGTLVSYGASFADLYRRAATYADRIFKGAKPGDLPVDQPTKFELVVNLKTAKAIGVTIPPALLQRADHVIQ